MHASQVHSHVPTKCEACTPGRSTTRHTQRCTSNSQQAVRARHQLQHERSLLALKFCTITTLGPQVLHQHHAGPQVLPQQPKCRTLHARQRSQHKGSPLTLSKTHSRPLPMPAYFTRARTRPPLCVQPHTYQLSLAAAWSSPAPRRVPLTVNH